jgi:transposase-like protein
MKEASHKESSPASTLRLVPEFGLVDVSGPALAERLAGKVSEQLELFASRMRQGLLAASVAIGVEVMAELVDVEVTEVAGPKGKHDSNRAAYRHGTEDGKVTLGGRRVPVCRPRVRTVTDDHGVEHEVRLESYDTFASVDLLADHMVASMLAGLSGRRYQVALEPVGETIEEVASGTSQSSVSRRFITATAERLAEFRSRPLDDQRWLICFVDGFDFAGHTMVGALGVTADGTKVPLGVVEGSTENATVVRGLISGLRDRGLDASEGVLFVLDGSKALAKAVRDVFGECAVIARCRMHKERNVLDHLPETERPWVRRKLRVAWANPDAAEGEAALKALAGQLERVNPDAAASLREGLAETLTVTRLGITGSLLKTVMSTNPVESMIEIVRAHARNVKRWQPGDMRLRWAAAGMLAASTQFRRVKGYRQLPQLAQALHHTIGADDPSTIAVTA